MNFFQVFVFILLCHCALSLPTVIQDSTKSSHIPLPERASSPAPPHHHPIIEIPNSHEELSQIVASARQTRKLMRLRHSQHHQLHQNASRVGSLVSINSKHGDHASSTASIESTQVMRTASGSQHGGQLSTGSGVRQVRGRKITVAHRTEMANRESDHIKKLYTEFEKDVIKKKKNLEAQLKEINLRIRDTQIADEKFEENVINAADPVTNKIPVKKFLKFIEDQSKLADTTSDKLNLKTVTAKRLIGETKKQIALREELGANLRPIDFEKLRIENEYLIKESDINNRTLTHKKLISGHYNLTLKHHKDRLLERKSKLQFTQKRHLIKQRENNNIHKGQVRTKREIMNLQDQLNYIKELQDEYEIPELNDFLEVQKQLHDAKRIFKNLQRKRRLQIFTFKYTRIMFGKN